MSPSGPEQIAGVLGPPALDSPLEVPPLLAERLRHVYFQILSTGSVHADQIPRMVLVTRLGIVPWTAYGHSGYMASDRNMGLLALVQATESDPDAIFIQCDEDTLAPLDAFRLALRFGDPAHGGLPQAGLVGSSYLCTSDEGLQIAALHPQKGRVLHPPRPGEPSAIEVSWVGTGCYAISRRAVLALIARFGHPFDFDLTPDGMKAQGCDVAMGDRIREIGLKVYLDRAFACGHAKKLIWAPGKDGSIIGLPWGSRWNGADIPGNSSEQRSLPELAREAVARAMADLEGRSQQGGQMSMAEATRTFLEMAGKEIGGAA